MGLGMGSHRTEEAGQASELGRARMRMRSSRALGRALGAACLAVASAVLAPACYSTGDGTAPPLDRFYFPVGLQVSNGGNVLYAANSDFDLQFNGGTIQAYDLYRLRQDVLRVIAWSKSDQPLTPEIPLVRPDDAKLPGNQCSSNPPDYRTDGTPQRQPLGQTCAPPVRSHEYVRDAVIVGAFATDMQLSRPPERLASTTPLGGPAEPPVGNRSFDRLFVPVRGNASLTWVSVKRDAADDVPGDGYAPFTLHCGKASDGRCDDLHSSGDDANDNSRNLKMPGEPFGLALSEDGQAAIVTHQTETKSSLLTTGLSRFDNDGPGGPGLDSVDSQPLPTLQFVLDGLPLGGVGVSAIPHDRDALPTFGDVPTPYPAGYLQTSRSTAQVALLRAYPDDGSTLQRPFLDYEASYPITIASTATDSRGIAIDPTPRLACKARLGEGATDEQRIACARKPARVFIANRTPASLIVGELGATNLDGSYDPDRLTFQSVVPLTSGPSKVYLAPIVDRDGRMSLRLFAICFDSDSVFVIDPDSLALESVIHVGEGPFALAFDPFTFEQVVAGQPVEEQPRYPGLPPVRPYRFAYLASFTKSFVQVIDLDNAQPDGATFERVVFTLGEPTDPKGS